MKRISYSQYNQWITCPHKWKLNYIDDLGEYTDSIHTLFGTSMHEVLQTYLTVMYNDTIKMADALFLDEMLLHRMKTNYTDIMENNGGEVFCEQHDMEEFYRHGLAILDWFVKKRGMYFSKRGYELVGVEVPIDYDLPNKIKFVGYIDVIIRNIQSGRIKIIDIKTSTRGWRDKEKKNKNKTSQVLLYKHFYSQKYNVPIDMIDVEYFIVKRKLWENLDFPQKPIQLFSPASGTVSVKRTLNSLSNFVLTIIKFTLTLSPY